MTSHRDWATCVITLDTDSRRYRDFATTNSHLPFEPFIGVRGSELANDQRISCGLATPELVTSGRLGDGAAGAAESHRRLWEKAVKTRGGMLIMEDDVVTHEGLADYITTHHELILQTTITHFGINTDSVVQAISPQGLGITALQDPRHPSPEWIHQALSLTNAGKSELWRLLKAFGMCCYFVSPHGAETLLKATFPLSLATTTVPFVSDKVPCNAVDRMLNNVYPATAAFVTVPFLAFTPNTDSSTRLPAPDSHQPNPSNQTP